MPSFSVLKTFGYASFSIALLAPLPAFSQDATALQQARASRIMYDAGVTNRDATMVLAAAKLRRSLGLQSVDRAAEGAAGDDASPLDVDAMFDTARGYATGDDALLGLIEDAQAEASKGVTNGPVYNVARIKAKASDIYRSVPFEARKYAEIYVEAADSSDLNLKVHDDQNRLVCSDTDISAIAYCGWKPRTDGSFSITIENSANRTVSYSLITN
jgi:hypothetical protein